MPVSILFTLDLPAASRGSVTRGVTLASAGNSGGRNNSDGHTDTEATGGNELYLLFIQFHFIMLIKSMTFLNAAEYLFSLYNKPIIIVCCHCPAHLCSPAPESLSIPHLRVSPRP